MKDSPPTLREYAAMALALGNARGALTSALNGDLQPSELRTALAATSLANIAAVLQTSEDDLAVDWSGLLTSEEIHDLTTAAKFPHWGTHPK